MVKQISQIFRVCPHPSLRESVCVCGVCVCVSVCGVCVCVSVSVSVSACVLCGGRAGLAASLHRRTSPPSQIKNFLWVGFQVRISSLLCAVGGSYPG